MSLQKALGELEEAVKDLTSLHVQTYSGRIDLELEGDKKFDDLRSKIENVESESSDLNLVAESLLRFDGDSQNFVAEDAPSNLREVHNEAVQSGLEARRSIIELFKDTIGV